jgi:hypothetical protein
MSISVATPSAHATEAKVAELLRGAIDPHVHSGPSAAVRSLDHLELLQQAAQRKFAAVVTKDHDYSGVATAALLRKHYGNLGTKIYSGIVLNNAVGGLNPYAVEHTAAMGGKIVWFPTLAAENHLRWQQKASFSHPGVAKDVRPVTPIPVLENGKTVRDDVKEILDVIAKTDMVLAAGHLHVSEIWLVLEEAKRRGVKRMVINHPEEVIDASMNDVGGLAALGAFIEHSLALFVEGSKFKLFDQAHLKNQIDAGGVGNTILSSDLGQVGSVGPVEGMAKGVEMCLALGYADDEIRQMISRNAARLFGIEEDVRAVTSPH